MATDTNPKRRDPLTRERVVEAAVRLADEVGMDALSMRRLGQELGVQAMSLYNHVPSKDSLLDAMVDAVFDEIGLPAASHGWKDALRRRSIEAREALGRHPWAIALMESRARPGPANLRHHEAVLRCLRESGFSLVQSVHAYSALDSYVYGFALQEAHLPFDPAGDMTEVSDAFLPQLGSAYPYLAETALEFSRTGYSFAREFEVGLDLVLDGLTRLLADTRSPEAGGARRRARSG